MTPAFRNTYHNPGIVEHHISVALHSHATQCARLSSLSRPLPWLISSASCCAAADLCQSMPTAVPNAPCPSCPVQCPHLAHLSSPMPSPGSSPQCYAKRRRPHQSHAIASRFVAVRISAFQRSLAALLCTSQHCHCYPPQRATRPRASPALLTSALAVVANPSNAISLLFKSVQCHSISNRCRPVLPQLIAMPSFAPASHLFSMQSPYVASHRRSSPRPCISKSCNTLLSPVKAVPRIAPAARGSSSPPRPARPSLPIAARRGNT